MGVGEVKKLITRTAGFSVNKNTTGEDFWTLYFDGHRMPTWYYNERKAFYELAMYRERLEADGFTSLTSYGAGEHWLDVYYKEVDA